MASASSLVKTIISGMQVSFHCCVCRESVVGPLHPVGYFRLEIIDEAEKDLPVHLFRIEFPFESTSDFSCSVVSHFDDGAIVQRERF